MTTTRQPPAGLERILAGRTQRIREKFAHLDTHQDPVAPPDLLLRGIIQDFDEATMSASFVISTQDIDRSGEIVETAGIRTESHKLNPVALWDHGRGPIGRLPIGKCEDPNGQYTVVVRPSDGIAVCRIFFSRTLPFASDVFRLIGEGIIRGVSIGFRTIDADPMPGYSFHDEDPPLQYREIELCEISPTAVPDNARALAIKVNKAFEGRRPSPELMKIVKAWETEKTGDKSMTQTAATNKLKVLGKSFTADLKALSESGKAALSKALAQITGKSADEYLQMDDDGKLEDETVADTQKEGMNSSSVADGGALTDPNQVVDTTKTGDAGDDKPAYQQPLEGPPGQAAYTDIHTQLGGIAETIEGWAARQDNDQVSKILENLAQAIDKAMATIEQAHDGKYDEHEPLGQTADEQKSAETDQDDFTEGNDKPEPREDDEDNIEKKSVRRLGLKAPARQRHEKRLTTYRTKSANMKRKLAAKEPADAQAWRERAEKAEERLKAAEEQVKRASEWIAKVSKKVKAGR